MTIKIIQAIRGQIQLKIYHRSQPEEKDDSLIRLVEQLQNRVAHNKRLQVSLNQGILTVHGDSLLDFLRSTKNLFLDFGISTYDWNRFIKSLLISSNPILDAKIKDELKVKPEERQKLLLLHRLEKKMARKLALESQVVQVRDIFFVQSYQNNYFRGEYDTPKDFKAEPLDTPEALLKRMRQQIQLMIDKGIAQHKKDNMDPKTNTFSLDEKNNVTRVFTNEFALYPSALQGPLSQDEFGLFISMIENLAMKAPQNVHLIIGSVPVQHESRVNNIGIYVQCGREPQIITSAKAFASDDDPRYLAGINADITFLSIAHDYILWIDLQLRLIMAELSQPNPMLNVARLIRVINKLQSHTQFPCPTGLIDLLIKIKENNTPDLRQVNEFKDALQNEHKQFEKVMDPFTDQDVRKLFTVAKQLPSAIFSETGKNTGWHYGGQVRWQTAGGLFVSTVFDICYDMVIGVGINAAQINELITRQAILSPIPFLINHCVLSNTQKPYPQMILGNILSHADSQLKYAGIFDKSKSPNAKDRMGELIEFDPFCVNETIQTPFGFTAEVRTTAPRKLQFRPELPQLIQYNQLYVKIAALRHYVNQRPLELDVINMNLRKTLILTALEQCQDNDLLTEEERDETLQFANEFPGKQTFDIQKSQDLGTNFMLLKKVVEGRVNPIVLRNKMQSMIFEAKNHPDRLPEINKQLMQHIILVALSFHQGERFMQGFPPLSSNQEELAIRLAQSFLFNLRLTILYPDAVMQSFQLLQSHMQFLVNRVFILEHLKRWSQMPDADLELVLFADLVIEDVRQSCPAWNTFSADEQEAVKVSIRNCLYHYIKNSTLPRYVSDVSQIHIDLVRSLNLAIVYELNLMATNCLNPRINEFKSRLPRIIKRAIELQTAGSVSNNNTSLFSMTSTSRTTSSSSNSLQLRR